MVVVVDYSRSCSIRLNVMVLVSCKDYIIIIVVVIIDGRGSGTCSARTTVIVVAAGFGKSSLSAPTTC